MSKIELYSNGLIIRTIDKIHEKYLGVEGDCWNIDEDTEGIDPNEGKFLNNFCSKNINISWSGDDIVEASADINFANRYVNAYLQANLQPLVLLCKTNKTIPTFHMDIESRANGNLIFIGFDYAYSGGSFYSCVFSDLYTKRIPELRDIDLNAYGLINSEEELTNFIERRNELIIKDEASRFEAEEFTIYKLWKYAGEFPIDIT
ncbi:hypothetical protein F4V43_16545 [Paenibacillus spiritus]|uniref:Uncharacterized protein n=1 Tax=Paenibacillus spiritus TaxID=2496557 RepID=A0A5J5FWP5_9BACL|nr:hypothetical protein [Paenibacillus spiritus]KAA8998361.1 hypothetical protein F4V43_16545 [Paenibacillus spiritus]